MVALQDGNKFQKNDKAIVSIEIEKLFNLYDYQLISQSPRITDLTELAILYGDNGSGKTTILKLIFHFLSAENNRGHRTFLAQVPFKKLRITLCDKTQLIAERLGHSLTGNYFMKIVKNNGKEIRLEVVVNEKGVVPSRDSESSQKKKEWQKFIGELKELNVVLYYLPENRKIESPFHDPEDEEPYLIFRDNDMVLTQKAIRRRRIEGDQSEIEATIKSTEEWIRREAIRAASIGEANTNTIYSDIIKAIAKSSSISKNRKNEDDLVHQLKDIEQRSKAFSQIGLVSPLDVSNVISILESTTTSQKHMINNILRPYANSLSAKLTALGELQEIIQTFVENINKFFVNKKLTFDLASGFVISASNQEELQSHMLSSGEKQLLLLFCNIVNARKQATIFIIDEPEISLNIKWQRQLLKTLMSLAKGTQIQFLIATHSIELLAQYRENVLRLEDRSTYAEKR